MDIGARDPDPSHNPFFVGSDISLVSMNRLPTTVPDPARLAVMPDARRSNDRCINESAGSQDDAVLIELLSPRTKIGRGHSRHKSFDIGRKSRHAAVH